MIWLEVQAQTVTACHARIVPAGIRWGRPWLAWTLAIASFLIIIFLAAFYSYWLAILCVPIFPVFERYRKARLFYNNKGFAEYSYDGHLLNSGDWGTLSVPDPSDPWVMYAGQEDLAMEINAAFVFALAQYRPDLLPRSKAASKTYMGKRQWGSTGLLLAGTGTGLFFECRDLYQGKPFSEVEVVTGSALLLWAALSQTWVQATSHGLEVRELWRRRIIPWDDLIGWVANDHENFLVLSNGSSITLNLAVMSKRRLSEAVKQAFRRRKFVIAR